MSDPGFDRIRGQFSAEKSEIGNVRSRVQQALTDTQNVLARMQATESELSNMQDSTLSDEKSNLKSNIYRMQSAKSYLQQALGQIGSVDLPDYVE